MGRNAKPYPQTRFGVLTLIGAALLVAVIGEQGAAQTTNSTKSRLELFQSQSRLLDGRLADQYEFSSRLKPETQVEVIPSWRGTYDGPHLATARAVARLHGVPENLFLRLVQQESAWNTAAVSTKGAIGLAQLMPDTAQTLGVDAADPAQNLDGGARYLRRQFERFGSWRLALAAYNAGPEAVERHGDVPPFAETRAYVTAILGR